MPTVVISLTSLAYVSTWYLNYTPPPSSPHYTPPITQHRFIPPSDELLERFNLVVSVYGHLLDSKTKKRLLRREALDAVERLRVHIKTGCISDSPAISLYFVKGKDKLTGVTLYRCARGTNDLEGFHKHMLCSLIEWCVGAGLGSNLLLELIYRWNLDRSISNRGLDGSIGGFCDQLIIKVLQVRWACVRTKLRVCRGISAKLLLALRLAFVFSPLGNRHPPRLSTCLHFFPAGDLLTILPHCFRFEPHPFCRK